MYLVIVCKKKYVYEIKFNFELCSNVLKEGFFLSVLSVLICDI